MKKMMKYSVLRFSPSRVSGEYINLGIIFDAPEDNYREFKHIKRFARLSSFDDEVNIDIVKQLLEEIRQDVERSIFTYDTFDIDKYVEFYINDYCFEKPRTITYDDLEEVTEALHKSFFRFEYERKERPSAEADKKMLARIIKETGRSVGRRRSELGKYNESITYDLVTEDYKIKVFDFDDKDLRRTVSSAKTWAWNSMNNEGQKVLFIYRYSDINTPNSSAIKTVLDILRSSGAEVLDIDSGMQKLRA